MSKDLNSQLWSYLPTFNYSPAGGDLAKWVTQTIIRSDCIPVDASLQEMTHPVSQLGLQHSVLLCFSSLLQLLSMVVLFAAELSSAMQYSQLLLLPKGS